MKYDDASWHYGGDFPPGLPEKCGAIHMGVFLAWAINRELVGDIHRDEWPEELEALKNRQMTGAEFVMSVCDEKFTDEDLNEKGNEFASYFYDDHYLGKYVDIADPDCLYESVYEIPDTWEVYERVTSMLDKEFAKWAAGRS